MSSILLDSRYRLSCRATNGITGESSKVHRDVSGDTILRWCTRRMSDSDRVRMEAVVQDPRRPLGFLIGELTLAEPKGRFRPQNSTMASSTIEPPPSDSVIAIPF